MQWCPAPPSDFHTGPRASGPTRESTHLSRYNARSSSTVRAPHFIRPVSASYPSLPISPGGRLSGVFFPAWTQKALQKSYEDSEGAGEGGRYPPLEEEAEEGRDWGRDGGPLGLGMVAGSMLAAICNAGERAKGRRRRGSEVAKLTDAPTSALGLKLSPRCNRSSP